MKRKIFTIATIAAMSVGAAMAAPDVKWLNPNYDFGAFKEDMGLVTCVFRGVNTGDEPLLVIDARANCGCTRPVYTKNAVAPGDTLKVTVSYDPTGRPGRFHKQVKVTTNSEGKASSILNIRGTVIGASNTLKTRYPITAGKCRVSNDVAPFGETTKGHVLAAAVNIYNPTQDTIVPAVADMPEYINAMFRPEVIPPGEQGTLSMTAYTDRCREWGVVESRFRLIPDKDHADDFVDVTTIMIVNEDFSKLTDDQRTKAPVAKVSTQALDFGRMSRRTGKAEQRFTITNTGRSPLLIRRIYSADKSLDIKTSTMKVKPGKSATVTVYANADKLESGDLLNARITLITNSPDNPTIMVRAVGEVTD